MKHLFALLLFCQAAFAADGHIRIQSGNSTTNTKSSAVSITAQTNLLAGSITSTSSVTAATLVLTTKTGTGVPVYSTGATTTNETLVTPILSGGLSGQIAAVNSSGTLVSTNSGANVGYLFTSGNTRVIFEGDSITATTGGGATGTNQWDGRLFALYMTGTGWVYGINDAVAGQTLATMAGQYAANIYPYRPASGTNAVLMLFAGINDIGAGTSGSSIFTTWSNYVVTARADGFIIVAFKQMKYQSLTSAQSYELDDFNERLEMAPNLWDYLIDLPHVMGAPPSENFSDYIHPNANGAKKIAAAVNYVLQRGRYSRGPSWVVSENKQGLGTGAYRSLSTAQLYSSAYPIIVQSLGATSDAFWFGPGITTDRADFGFVDGSGSLGTGTAMRIGVSNAQFPGSMDMSIGVGSAVTLGETNHIYIGRVDAQTYTLPTSVGKRGRDYIVKIADPALTGTVATTSSQTIDGATTYSLAASNAFVRVVSDNTNWWIIGKNP